MARAKTDSTVLTIRVPERLDRQLGREARRRGRTRGHVARSILEAGAQVRLEQRDRGPHVERGGAPGDNDGDGHEPPIKGVIEELPAITPPPGEDGIVSRDLPLPTTRRGKLCT